MLAVNKNVRSSKMLKVLDDNVRRVFVIIYITLSINSIYMKIEEWMEIILKLKGFFKNFLVQSTTIQQYTKLMAKPSKRF